MVQKYLMAIDAGTGSVRVILFDTYGNEIYVSQSEWTHKEDSRYPGSMNFDVHTNFNIISKLIKKTVTESKIDPNHILAISTTSMREAIVLYDENGIELWACANVDSRSDNEVINLNKSYPKLEKEIYQISGQTFSLGAIPRILWVKNNLPNLYQKTRYVTMLNDWITYKLTNIISVEPSNGCTTGLFNIKNRTWDSTLANRVDLKDDIYPIVHESGTVIGNVTNEIAGLTGLSTKTKVVAGGGDAQLGCIGLGVIHEGDAAVLGGSFWQYEYTTTSIKPDESARVRVNCHAIPNTWQYEAIAFYPGLVMRWFRDSFCELEKYMQDQINQNVYEQMENRAAKVPVGSYGMIATFSNKMNYISWKHAAPSFINFKLDAEKYNKATFYRAIMENAAFVTRGNIELVSDITNTYPDTIIFAGGASNSDLWCQIVSDVLNKPVKVPIVKESTALGAAICAGIGANVYDSLQDAISKVVKIEKEYQPIQENHLIYSRLYEKWESVYLHQLNLADKGLTEHMWSSPGV
ncbi:autoinducer-2 kinase [Oceanobacillus profundus]|uniref:autoinducer-2 kinase n=1 Tax=Oceanobacillus profundus TaxID=372463 RepID=UPI00203E41E2|nr:autoinducer-2 kinase [Oceanobacillus profundus]MCM3399925.1 autoinducer-2 kinase [Oceanobacillus profundus]